MTALIENFPVGKHPLISRLFKGVFNLRPPRPKYIEFWSVDQVVEHLKGWGSDLNLKYLTWKLVILLALSTVGRSFDLMRISAGQRRHTQSGVLLI